MKQLGFQSRVLVQQFDENDVKPKKSGQINRQIKHLSPIKDHLRFGQDRNKTEKFRQIHHHLRINLNLHRNAA